MKKRFGLWLMMLGMVFVLAACGESDKSVIPDPGNTNPFAGARVGTDSTLEIVSWNIEHFAKKGDLTVDAVIQAIEAMDADIIALQEIENFTQFRTMRERLKSWDGRGRCGLRDPGRLFPGIPSSPLRAGGPFSWRVSRGHQQPLQMLRQRNHRRRDLGRRDPPA
jgi:hypothetical protein